MTSIRVKDIIYCRTAADFDHYLEEVDNQKVLPQCRIIIDYDGSLYEELDGLWPVARLSRIKQLGLAEKCRETFSGGNSRYGHSITFAAKIDHLSQELGLDRELAVTTAMLHDIATPPFSDSFSKAFGINDERYFLRVLESWPDALDYLQKHGIRKEKVGELVRGEDESPLGQLVNSKNSIDVDRWSYTVCDASPFLRLPEKGGFCLTIDPFENASVMNGKVVFGDIGEVGALLEARTKMFENVYRNGLLMAKEAFAKRLVTELQERGLIDVDNLMHMTDEDFQGLVMCESEDFANRLFNIDGFAEYGSLDADVETVKQELSKLTENPFEVVRYRPCNPAIGTPILAGKKVKPYSELRPEHAAELKRRMSAWNVTHVYGYENDETLAEAVKKLQGRLVA